MRIRAIAVAAVWAAGLAVAPLATADLYRCKGPDGRTVFSDNPAACPGATPHQPRGRVQSVPSAARPTAVDRAASQQKAALRQEAERDQATYWGEKRRRSEEQLRALESEHASLREYVTWCNRGGELVKRDASGLKSRVSCSSVRGEFEALEGRIASLRAYLDEGLAEECRRAGCLPGWIR